MSDTKLGFIPCLNVNEAVNNLSLMYVNYIKNNISLECAPSVMLWGAPGIGKSQSIRQIGSIIEEKTCKKVVIRDVRLLLFNPVDLRGIPTFNEDRSLAIWLKPQIFDFKDDPNVVNILFLDEITAATPSVQASAYQITLDKKIGEHKLPPNTVVICAGNRLTDKSVSYQMPKALANRLLHFEIQSEFDSWNIWAIKHNIHRFVLGFIKFSPKSLNTFSESESGIIFATPRSWEMVSNILNNVSEDLQEVFNLISGIIGSGLAIEFKNWCKVYKDLPNIENIFLGKETKVPTKLDTLYALVSSILEYAKKHKDNLIMIENSIVYASRLPADFSFILLKDYLFIEPNYRTKLMTINAYQKWISQKGKLINVTE